MYKWEKNVKKQMKATAVIEKYAAEELHALNKICSMLPDDGDNVHAIVYDKILSLARGRAQEPPSHSVGESHLHAKMLCERGLGCYVMPLYEVFGYVPVIRLRRTRMRWSGGKKDAFSRMTTHENDAAKCRDKIARNLGAYIDSVQLQATHSERYIKILGVKFYGDNISLLRETAKDFFRERGYLK